MAALAALGSLLQLVPARSEDRAQLSELETAVSEQEVRVDRLRERFTYYFDPTQLESIVREEGQKIHPQQRPIVWIDAP